MFDRLRSDLTFGVRQHLKTPATSAVIVLTLALGIAATSASFSLVNGFFIRPPAIDTPERFVRLYNTYANGPKYFTVSYPDFQDMRDLRDVFAGAVVEEPAPLTVGIAGSYERVWGERVSDGYFPVLGIKPAYGRFFAAAEEMPGGGDVVVLSHGFWHRRFGASPAVLSTPLIINGRSFLVIGVAPARFQGTTLGLISDLWIPVSAETRVGQTEPSSRRGGGQYFAMARLHPSVTVDQAQAALDLLARRLQREYPASNTGLEFTALPESEGRVFPMVRGSILGLSAVTVAVAVLVLLVGCANVAGLMLVRAAARRGEIGVRLALGASRRRIIAQLLAEAASLSLAAGSIGLLLAWQSTRWLTAARVTIARGAPISVDVSMDGRVLALSFVVTVLTGILFSLAPALEASQHNLIGALKDGQPRGGGRRSRARNALVAAQVACALVLLTAGGLFLRSLQHARGIDPGFDPDGVVTASVDLTVHEYPLPVSTEFWARLLAEIRRLPDTQSASLSTRLPLDLGIVAINIGPDGYRPPGGQSWPSIDVATIETQYFRTMRIALLQGREFDDRDMTSATPVAIVNDVLARQFWPGAPALGRHLVSPAGDRYQVVGVARRSKYFSIGEEPKPYVYFPLQQGGSMTVVARGSGDRAAYLRKVTDTIHRLDPIAPVYDIATMADRVAMSMAPTTGGAAALTIVGLMALALTSLGLYGTIAQTVGWRTYEIGVRRALGARDADVVRLVVGDATALVLLGMGVGLAAGLGSARLLRALLYSVDARDPLVFGVAPLVLAAVSVIAAWIPTWRAVRISAATALRYE